MNEALHISEIMYQYMRQHRNSGSIQVFIGLCLQPFCKFEIFTLKTWKQQLTRYFSEISFPWLYNSLIFAIYVLRGKSDLNGSRRQGRGEHCSKNPQTSSRPTSSCHKMSLRTKLNKQFHSSNDNFSLIFFVFLLMFSHFFPGRMERSLSGVVAF